MNIESKRIEGYDHTQRILAFPFLQKGQILSREWTARTCDDRWIFGQRFDSHVGSIRATRKNNLWVKFSETISPQLADRQHGS